MTGELLYDLPQFDMLSPNAASPSPRQGGASLSRYRSPNAGSKREQNGGWKERSLDGSSLMANAGSSQTLQRNSNVSAVEEKRPKRRSTSGRENKPLPPLTGGANSNLTASPTGLAYKLTPQLGSSPNPHARVGTLMMSASYDEDEVEASYGRRQLGDVANRPPTRFGLGVMIRSDSTKENDSAYVESAIGTPEFASTTYSYSPQTEYRRQTTATNDRRSSANERRYTPLSDRRFTASSVTTTPGIGKVAAIYRDVPSLPPIGGPNLQQIKMMRDQPDYRSPTYSIYGLYRDQSRVSPLNTTPAELTYYTGAPGERL